MTAMELRGVTKEFGDVTAVRDLDLTVEDGEVYGFLGPNGAGKSTTIDMLLDLVRPTAGTVRVLGADVATDGVDVRRRTGVLPDGFSVYDRLSGRKHVEFAVESKEAADDPDALLARVGLADAADRAAGEYSKGMRQRLALAMALVDDPDLLVLDEPSSGLDPAGAKEMREIVRAEAERGATVFFSSHILEQVDAVCDRVGILRDGELVAEDSVEGLREAVGGEETLDVAAAGADDEAMAAVRALDGVSGVTRDGDELVVNCDSDAKTEVIAALEDAGVAVADFHTREASLEDLFLAYTEGDAATRDAGAAASAPTEGEPTDDATDDDSASEEVDR
ncbi:ABC transporter ATP-binding protein [Halorubrum ezzemoulense]|uniref:ABC transporter ATP-binding protein n=1 Tax=Halorubrum ezzemoulense TaxID=337243 RepID=A0ABT4Z2B5_HALEZ|nr:ABC transporter ATP-binding protein [Halorubrum ezzemoulense]MDB2244130.1 ABC transporter ATP-binding protein [Halorubrum ezzemoulense]MDB2277866.1 ABC transporter ATP-binding protein [Halorubrum ezzemoulense]MDB2284652.1 ABC transporter ATP-binding protein [Halorubrum ezzemoulense]MDB2289493.1 ABC transporter ATP-binding protein [Halorubrum ezzemoulense]MDB2292299.1 ABC transporter ATP-binding protein [Halorubrum ezzemoulense]